VRGMGGLRFGLLNGSGASLLSLLLALGACGGRTTMLDSDMVSVDANRPSEGSKGGNSGAKPNTGTGASTGTAGSVGSTGGSTAAGGTTGAGAVGTGAVGAGANTATAGAPAAGGTPGTGASGNTAGWTSPAGASTGHGGAAGAGGVDSWAFGNCIDYCKTSSPPQPCTSGLSSTACASSCTAELGRLDLACQKVAGSLLECLTTVYHNSKDCGDVQELTAAKCSTLFASYESCSSKFPDPPPPPPSTPTGCSSSGSASANECSLNMTCGNGTNATYYSAYCFQTAANQASCFCDTIFPDGSSSGLSIAVNESLFAACADAPSICGFPRLGGLK
jgi:hypothetical protein